MAFFHTTENWGKKTGPFLSEIKNSHLSSLAYGLGMYVCCVYMWTRLVILKSFIDTNDNAISHPEYLPFFNNTRKLLFQQSIYLFADVYGP